MPDRPTNLSNLPKITNAYQVGLSWIKPENEGGTAILDYTLLYDNGSNGSAFIVFAENIVETTFTATSLVPGVNY